MGVINGGDKCEINVRLCLAFMDIIHHSNLVKDKWHSGMIGQNTLICVHSDLALRFSDRPRFFRIVTREETSRTCHALLERSIHLG